MTMIGKIEMSDSWRWVFNDGKWCLVVVKRLLKVRFCPVETKLGAKSVGKGRTGRACKPSPSSCRSCGPDILWHEKRAFHVLPGRTTALGIKPVVRQGKDRLPEAVLHLLQVVHLEGWLRRVGLHSCQRCLQMTWRGSLDLPQLQAQDGHVGKNGNCPKDHGKVHQVQGSTMLLGRVLGCPLEVWLNCGLQNPKPLPVRHRASSGSNYCWCPSLMNTNDHRATPWVSQSNVWPAEFRLLGHNNHQVWVMFAFRYVVY